ncbi:hypothetical protein DFR50_104106 [Roseiarcus fermentans]|uniref:PBP family phospholipid-binding protein n=1 Tax=Roseiarcus fermentans TaxID=1473586 RepID=A0A366FSZ1_9HYPH|nr:YbhB/YbcL family Raf kinase inhibitor-like protein [Roseiarcus fermentans]RBP16829.1 hypothetical protein DFR50_104106 [Roseiarcus fermentans]
MHRKVSVCRGLALLAGLASPIPAIASEATLSVRIDGLDAGGWFPDSAAFCPPASSARKDVSPAISWTAGPPGTRSYAILMTDPDVPQDFGQINRAGVTIPAAAPRVRVFHWALVDVPSSRTALAQGEDGDRLVPGGKPVGETGHGRRGANVYTTFLANVHGMAGLYGGYDGPCPPANDERVHRYSIRVIALDVATLGLTGAFDGEAALAAAEGHILASGAATADYALNPALAKK